MRPFFFLFPEFIRYFVSKSHGNWEGPPCHIVGWMSVQIRVYRRLDEFMPIVIKFGKLSQPQNILIKTIHTIYSLHQIPPRCKIKDSTTGQILFVDVSQIIFKLLSFVSDKVPCAGEILCEFDTV